MTGAPPSSAAQSREALVEEARQSIAKGSKSFATASLLFDPQTRDRTFLFYAWCRRCDDIADGQEHGGELEVTGEDLDQRVEMIRTRTRKAMAGEDTGDFAFDALGIVAGECGLTQEMADDVIDGFQLDEEGWRPRTEGDLMRYCFHVAGAVGVMMARIMGVAADDHDTLDRACDLGLAFQLNNIARDISEDDAAGRCYLPVEWLVEMDIPPGEHMKPQYRDKLALLAKRLVDLAEEHEAAARLGAARLTFRQRWAILAAASIYGDIGRKVRARGKAAWDTRTYTTKGEKIGHLLRSFFEAHQKPKPVKKLPRWTRAELMVIARANVPPATMPERA